MTRQSPEELRRRMQKVASKPPQHPDAPRRTRAASSRRSRTTTSGTRPADSRAAEDAADLEVMELDEPEVKSRTRIAILGGWAMWEIVSVPRTRLKYIRDLLAGS